MKKMFMLLLLLITSNLLSITSSAQESGKVFLFGGGSLPMDPEGYTKYYNFGFNVGAGYLNPINETVDFQAEILYNNNSINSEKLIEDAGGNSSDFSSSGGGYSSFAFLGGGKLNLTGNKFSLLLGGGYYRSTFEEYKLTHKASGMYIKVDSATEGKFGFYAGAQFNLDKLSIKARLHNVLTDDESTRLFEFGIVYYFQ